MAVLGDQLNNPESGWQRYDDTNDMIVYTGTWLTETLAGNYNGSAKYTSTSGSTMSFTFYGTKIRIIGGLYSGRTTTAQVIIDGINVGIINEDSTTSRTKALVFEKNDLSQGKHVVQIKTVDNKTLILDAIDVGEDGYMTRSIGVVLTAPDAGWKRYDDNNLYFNITNVPSITHASAYGGTIRYIAIANNSKIQFEFQGTKIRFIASTGVSNYSPSVGVKIDGVEFEYSLAINTSHQIFVFEKLELEDKRHTVEIYTKDSLSFSFDAIDIDSNGQLITTVGSQIPIPEEGWRRYDDSVSSIKYVGNFTNGVGAGAYNGYSNYTSTIGDKIVFDFEGTKLRLIGARYTNRSDLIEVYVDGKLHGTHSQLGSELAQVLQVEIVGLPKARHQIEIVNKSSGSTTTFMALDAIDIDLDGRLFHPDEVANIAELEVGKRIRCNYVSNTSGVAGEFKNLGKQTSDFISTTSVPSSPSGDFYFIVADEYNKKKILIADRPIQAAITWDALNSNGLVFGVQKDLGVKNYMFVARLLSGGYSAADKDNEWDQYIVNSTLNGNIIAGDDRVWNWSAGYSLASTTNANSANRVRRGATTVATFSAAASSSTSSSGYRPLFELETLPMFKSFIKHDGSYKKYVPKVFIESNDNAIPVMTSNTSPSGVASASSINSVSFDAYQAFNGIQDERYGWASLTPVSWLQYQFPAKKIIYKYSLAMRTNGTYYVTGEPPKSWTFEGSNDGINWIVLDTQTNNTTLARGSIEEYRINNSDAYIHYRVNVSANQGNASITVIAELKMFEKTPKDEVVGWNTISATLPSEDTFINEGMDDLSVLDRKNEVFVQTMTVNGSLGSGKLFKGNIDLKKYFEITGVSVK